MPTAGEDLVDQLLAQHQQIKVLFAKEIVARFHSQDAATRADEEFGKAPQDMELFRLAAPPGGFGEP